MRVYLVLARSPSDLGHERVQVSFGSLGKMAGDCATASHRPMLIAFLCCFQSGLAEFIIHRMLTERRGLRREKQGYSQNTKGHDKTPHRSDLVIC